LEFIFRVDPSLPKKRKINRLFLSGFCCMPKESITTYQIVTLQIQALNSLLTSALAEPDIEEGFRQDMERIRVLLEDFLHRSLQAEEQDFVVLPQE
jgi:hypothetical protein